MRKTMRATTTVLAASWLTALSLYAQDLAVANPVDDILVLVDEGKDAMYRLEYATAREVFSGIIEQYPESPVGYGMMQVATFNEMLWAASNPALQDYGAPSPYSGTKIHKSLDEESRRFRESTDRLLVITESILERDPENVEALYFRGLAEENLAAEAIIITRSRMSAFNHGRAANGMHQDVLELDPTFVDAQVSVGAYEFALATLPGTLKVLLAPACLFGFLCGDKDEAFELMEEAALNGRYRNLDAQVLLIVMHAEQGDPARAVELLQSLRERYPESYVADLNLAGIQERKLEDPDAALETLQALLDSLPSKTPGLGEGEVHFRIGKTHFNFEDYDRAQEAFRRAIDSRAVQPETRPLSYFYLGQIHEALDLEEDAAEFYGQFVELADNMESLEAELETVNRRLH